jgi:hypothetical protein
MLCALSIMTGCTTITAEYPAPGQPIQARAGQALVFGRLQVIGNSGAVYFPLRGLSKPPQAALVERFEPSLSLLRLGSPVATDWSPDLHFNDDGTLAVWVPTGYYALVSISPKRGGKAYVEAVAFLRVPAEAVAVYAGDLTATLDMEPTAHLLEPQPYWIAYGTVTSNLAAAQKELEMKHGPLPSPPVVSLWCLAGPGEGDLATLDHAVAISRLNTGCGNER